MADFRDKVEFRSISMTYPTDAHVACNYLLKGAYRPSSYDWIGLFKVGWSTNKDVLYFHWAPYPKSKQEGEEHTGSVMFQAQTLPKDDGEFYQFVYFNDRNKMCGASSPFQFREPRNDDLVEQEVEDDILLITTNRLVLEEKLRHMELERDQLNEACCTVSAQKDALQDKISESELFIEDLRLQKDTIQAQKQMLEKKIAESETEHNRKIAENQMELHSQQEEIGTLTIQLDNFQQQIDEKEAECVQVRNELDKQIGLVEALKKEIELIKTHCTTAEDARQQACNELEQVKTKMTEDMTEREAIDTLQAQVNSSQETIEDLTKHIQQQKNVIEASTAKQVVLEGEINTLNETLIDMSTKIERVNTENHDIKTKLAQHSNKHESEREEWQKTLDNLSQEKNSLVSTIAKLDRDLLQAKERAANTDEFDEQEDRYVALQTAYAILKDELSKTDRDLQKLKKKEAKFQQSDRQILELQARLKLGEEEWKKVNLQKVEAERKLQRSVSRTSLSEEKVINTQLTTSLSGGDLTKDELQKMVEQLSKELELRTQKKDKYKQKYLDEKQRAATVRDDHTRNEEKMHKDLELARAQLDSQLLMRPPSSKSYDASSHVVTPIVYPPVIPPQSPPPQSPPPQSPQLSAAGSTLSNDGGAKPKMDGPSIFPRQMSDRGARGDRLSKGALEESITEDQEERRMPLKPLPAPIEPTKVQEFKDTLRQDLGLTSPQYPESYAAPAAVTRNQRAEALSESAEVAVVTRIESDDENDTPDRFHDASSEVPASMVKCFMCDKVFHSEDSEAARNAHANEHLSIAGEQESDVYYTCPICNKKFPKSIWSNETVSMHVNSHFTISNDE